MDEFTEIAYAEQSRGTNLTSPDANFIWAYPESLPTKLTEVPADKSYSNCL